MITRPEIHAPTTTVGELRAFFEDDHVHAALLVDAGRLVAVVERAELRPEVADGAAAATIATVDGKTVGPDTPVAEALAVMSRSGRRRLAVTGESSQLLGLLCLKASGAGFCSDTDVGNRKDAVSGDGSG
jgi:CBS domain-containing protein